jgi:hypothetical protein
MPCGIRHQVWRKFTLGDAERLGCEVQFLNHGRAFYPGAVRPSAEVNCPENAIAC